MDVKLSGKERAKSKILCIETRRLLWLKKDQHLAKQLVDLKKLLLEEQKLAKAAEKELQLASSTRP